jgi:Uma2 family endonuclease
LNGWFLRRPAAPDPAPDDFARWFAFFWEGAPDLAVEVTSPWDTRPEVARKVQAWLSAGTGVVWVVDPKDATVTIHRPGRAARRLAESDRLDGAPLLPDFSLPVGEIFAL